MKYQPRKIWLVLVVSAIVLVVRFYFNTLGDLKLLDRAEASLNQNDFASARSYLDSIHRLSFLHFFEKPGRLSFLKAAILFQQGQKAESAQYFGTVSPDSAYYAKSRISLAEIRLDQGRWREAEEIVFQLTLQLASQNANQNDQVAALKLLDRYYRMQARFDDTSKILMHIAEISDNPLPVLREYWRTSRGTIPVELIEKTIAICQTLSPDDSRLWLAKANLAIQKNDFQAASLALAECEKPGQNPDLAVSRSRFRLAFLLNQSDSLIQAAKNLNISDKISPGEIVRLAHEISTFFDLQDYKKPTFEVWESLEPANPVFLARYAEFISQMSRPDLIRTINERKSLSDKSQEHWQKLILGPSEPTTKTAILEWINAAENAGELRVARVLVGLGLRKFSQDQDLNIIFSDLNTKIQSSEGKLPACRELLAKVLQAADEKVASPAYKSQVNTNPETPLFEKITDESGFQFQYQNGETEIRQMPVALGGGVALIDFDQDGLLDIFAVQGGSLPHGPDNRNTGDRLFRNLGKMQFLDVTSELKLPAKSVGYGVGVAVGDVNNDSWPDLFITRFGSYSLYLNRDGMGFTDETAAWGLGGSRDWPTSAAFADFDNDGDLDLYVCHYVVWDEKNPRICRHADTLKFMSCNPTTCAAQPDHLFRNDGGRFTDVSDMAGITGADKQGRGLGVIAADLDADGLTDIFVANDKSANFLFKNRGQMQFEEVAHLAGVAAGADGSYQAGMGVACGDYNGDGRPDLAVTNYYGESSTLYQNSGNMFFIDRTSASGLASYSRLLLGFGMAFFDANNDGILDLVSTNGHTDDFGDVPYRMPAQLLLGQRTGRFFDASSKSGRDVVQPRLGRGLATGDLDNDGRLDLLFLPQNEPAALLANRSSTKNHWLEIQLVGQKSNRDAVGAKLILKTDKRIYHSLRFGGGSYQSAISPRLHFAWLDSENALELEIQWPSGTTSKIANPPADRLIAVDEIRGYNQASVQPRK